MIWSQKWNIFPMLLNLLLRVCLLIINAVFEIVDLDLKLKTWAYVVSELQCVRFL